MNDQEYVDAQADLDGRGGYIETFTGKKFHLDDPDPESIDIIDIAAALGKKCRYGGQCARFYSVAQHCVLVSRYTDDPLEGLLHDAHEAYIPDMPKPFKALIDGWRDLEDRLEATILETFGLASPVSKDTKRVDSAILADEVNQLIRSRGDDRWVLPEEPVGVAIVPWTPTSATARFLDQFGRLTDQTDLVDMWRELRFFYRPELNAYDLR